MSSFAMMSEEDYALIQFPTTPPSFKAAKDIAAKFESLSLGHSSNSCSACGTMFTRQRPVSFDGQCCESPKQSAEGKGAGGGSSGAFVYEGVSYCSLDCFFDAHVKEPCLCRYVDALAAAIFPSLSSQHK